MYTVVKQIKRSFAIFSALFITVLTTSKVRGHQDCGPEKLVECAKPLSVLTDSGLTFASTKAELDRMCPDLRHALRCIHTYTRHCMKFEEQKHFKKLFHGTGHIVSELCRNGTFQREYLQHAPCNKKVELENEICLKKYTETMKEIEARTIERDGNVEEEEEEPVPMNPSLLSSSSSSSSSPSSPPPDMFISYQKRKREAADEGIKSVCCSFQQYVECTTNTMSKACGEEAANFSRNFLDRMSSSLIQLHCTEYGRRECGLLSTTSSGGGRTTTPPPTTMATTTTTTILLILSFLVYYIR